MDSPMWMEELVELGQLLQFVDHAEQAGGPVPMDDAIQFYHHDHGHDNGEVYHFVVGAEDEGSDDPESFFHDDDEPEVNPSPPQQLPSTQYPTAFAFFDNLPWLPSQDLPAESQPQQFQSWDEYCSSHQDQVVPDDEMKGEGGKFPVAWPS